MTKTRAEVWIEQPMVRVWGARVAGALHECFVIKGNWRSHCGLFIGDYGIASELLKFENRADIDCLSCCAEIARARLLQIDEEIR